MSDSIMQLFEQVLGAPIPDRVAFQSALDESRLKIQITDMAVNTLGYIEDLHILTAEYATPEEHAHCIAAYDALYALATSLGANLPAAITTQGGNNE